MYHSGTNSFNLFVFLFVLLASSLTGDHDILSMARKLGPLATIADLGRVIMLRSLLGSTRSTSWIIWAWADNPESELGVRGSVNVRFTDGRLSGIHAIILLIIAAEGNEPWVTIISLPHNISATVSNFLIVFNTSYRLVAPVRLRACIITCITLKIITCCLGPSETLGRFWLPINVMMEYSKSPLTLRLEARLKSSSSSHVLDTLFPLESDVHCSNDKKNELKKKRNKKEFTQQLEKRLSYYHYHLYW